MWNRRNQFCKINAVRSLSFEYQLEFETVRRSMFNRRKIEPHDDRYKRSAVNCLSDAIFVLNFLYSSVVSFRLNVWISHFKFQFQTPLLNGCLSHAWKFETSIEALNIIVYEAFSVLYLYRQYFCVKSKAIQRNHTQYSNMFRFRAYFAFISCIYIETRYFFNNNCRRFLEICMLFFSLCSVTLISAIESLLQFFDFRIWIENVNWCTWADDMYWIVHCILVHSRVLNSKLS